MKTYIYIVFLKCPKTDKCINQEIAIDADNEFLSARDLFSKLDANNALFEEGYTLIGLNVADVRESL